MLTLGMELINIFGTKSVAPKASANFDDWHGHIAITRNGKDYKAYSYIEHSVPNITMSLKV